MLRRLFEVIPQSGQDLLIEKVGGSEVGRTLFTRATGLRVVDGLGAVGNEEVLDIPLAPRGRSPDKYQPKS